VIPPLPHHRCADMSNNTLVYNTFGPLP
jgi:hypothetical protein